jgi:hypothetical protein
MSGSTSLRCRLDLPASARGLASLCAAGGPLKAIVSPSVRCLGTQTLGLGRFTLRDWPRFMRLQRLAYVPMMAPPSHPTSQSEPTRLNKDTLTLCDSTFSPKSNSEHGAR